MSKKWIKRVKRHIREIENMNPKDRLELVSSILKCNNAIAGSCNGWAEWISNPSIMNKFSERHLKAILEEFKEIAIPFLKADIKWTEYLLSLSNKEDEQSDRSVEIYIS